MTVALAALLLLDANSQEPPTIQFIEDGFRIQGAANRIWVPVRRLPMIPRSAVSFRQGVKWAVWDERRGMTIRAGRFVKSSKLQDVPLSPKLFSREEILRTRSLISSGRRTREASALSGAKRLGDVVFLLARWEERDGRPWLESLISVDLAEKRPTWKLIGRFDGFTLADQPVDDKLLMLDGQLAVVARLPSGWGVARYDPKSTIFTSILIGQRLACYFPLSQRLGIALEPTGYGATVVRRVDLTAASTETLFETRGDIELVDASDPLLFILRRSGETLLHNADSGAEERIPSLSRVKRTDMGVLIWSPASSPTYAILYDPSRWSILARWNRVPPPKSALAQPRSRSAVPAWSTSRAHLKLPAILGPSNSGALRHTPRDLRDADPH